MSQHSNQASKAPTSSRNEIRGSGATYKASIQKQSRSQSSTKAGGDGKRKRDLSVDGASRTTKTTVVQSESGTNANTGGYGSGHYTPSK